MAMTSDRWTSRSTMVTTQVALGKTSPHSAKGLLVVMTVGRFSYRRATTSKSKSAWRASYERCRAAPKR